MARYVYVFPQEIIKGVSADLAQRNSVKDAVAMLFDKVVDGDINGFNVALLLEFPSPLVPDGQVNIAASGQTTAGAVEAELSAVMKLFEGLRSNYQFFPADYNYIVISEKRTLFNAMKIAFDPCRADFVEMSIATKDCLSELQGLCQVFSSWIGDHHPYADKDDLVAASAFHSVMKQQALDMDTVVRHASRLSDNIVLRICPAEYEDSFDSTVPVPMEINWERCFYTLQVIYTEAVKKVRGVVNTQFVVRARGGQFRASVEVTESPYLFSGEPTATQHAALAKLFFAVIKHVNVQLGYSILDFHNGIRHRQDEYIARFDRNMKGMKGCAELLHELVDETKSVFDQAVVDLTMQLQINVETETVLAAVASFSAKLSDSKRITDLMWHRVDDRQVMCSTLEANLGLQG